MESDSFIFITESDNEHDGEAESLDRTRQSPQASSFKSSTQPQAGSTRPNASQTSTAEPQASGNQWAWDRTLVPDPGLVSQLPILSPFRRQISPSHPCAIAETPRVSPSPGPFPRQDDPMKSMRLLSRIGRDMSPCPYRKLDSPSPVTAYPGSAASTSTSRTASPDVQSQSRTASPSVHSRAATASPAAYSRAATESPPAYSRAATASPALYSLASPAPNARSRTASRAQTPMSPSSWQNAPSQASSRASSVSLTPEPQQLFRCPDCGTPFATRDILNMHLDAQFVRGYCTHP